MGVDNTSAGIKWSPPLTRQQKVLFAGCPRHFALGKDLFAQVPPAKRGTLMTCYREKSVFRYGKIFAFFLRASYQFINVVVL